MKLTSNIFNRNFFFLIVTDSFFILVSFYLSIVFRFDFIIPDSVKYYFTSLNGFTLIAIKIFSFKLFGLYRGMWRYTSVWDMLNIFKGNILATLVMTIATLYTIGFQELSRSVMIIDFIVCTGIICIFRLGIRMFFSHIKDLLKIDTLKSNKIDIILIGAGDAGQTILHQFINARKSPVRVIGILDDNKNKIGRKLHGVNVIGGINMLKSLKLHYDEIYICIPSATKNQINVIIRECKKTTRPFKTLPSMSELLENKPTISQFREVSIYDLLGRQEVELDTQSIEKLVRGNRVLITGAGGSIGSELVRQCIKYTPSLLIMIDSNELNLFEIDRESQIKDSKILFKPILSDIRDSFLVNQIFEEYRPQIVLHAAAYKHVPIQEVFPWEAIKTNVFGTYNLAKSAIENNVEKFVLVSTDKAVRPVNVMGATKRLAEIIMQNYNSTQNKTAFMAVRFGNVLGSSGSVIPIFKDQIKKGGPVTITDPDMERYFMSIPEASQLILQAGALGNGGEVFILDMGSPVKIIDLAIELIKLSGFKPELDIPIKITGARPGEKKTEELSLPTEHLDKTKHNKIFVLGNYIDDKILAKIIIGIDKLKDESRERNPSKIRSILASVLDEYKPYLAKDHQSKLLNKDGEKANA
jgi:FlaA1/EpsC-like NDP-sugar epimerase